MTSSITIGGSGSFRTITIERIDAAAADRITEFCGESHPEGMLVLLVIRPGLAGDVESAIRAASELEIAWLIARQTDGHQGVTTVAAIVGDMTGPGILLSMGATFRWCVQHSRFSGAGLLPSDIEFCRIRSRRRLTDHAGRTLSSGCGFHSEAAEHFGLVDVVHPNWQTIRDLIRAEMKSRF